jgi:hypothetical protein
MWQPENLKRGNAKPEVQTLADREPDKKTRHQVADALGVSHETLRKTRAVVDAASRSRRLKTTQWLGSWKRC